MADMRSRNKSTRANTSSAQQGPLSSAQQEPDIGVSAACAKPVALQADPSPLSAQLLTAQTAATSTKCTWASLVKPATSVVPSVANTTAAPAPSQ